jgi:hypothetical protein
MDEPSSFLNAFTLHPGSTTIGAALEDGVDEAVGLIESDGGHWNLRFASTSEPALYHSLRVLSE